MTVAELRQFLAAVDGDLRVVVEARSYDDPYVVGVANASRVDVENRGDGIALYISGTDEVE